MITMEIKKLLPAKYGKIAQFEFKTPGVGVIKTKSFLAWGFGVADDAKEGDKAEITPEEFKQLKFELQEMKDAKGEARTNDKGEKMTCLRVKLA